MLFVRTGGAEVRCLVCGGMMWIASSATTAPSRSKPINAHGNTSTEPSICTVRPRMYSGTRLPQWPRLSWISRLYRPSWATQTSKPRSTAIPTPRRSESAAPDSFLQASSNQAIPDMNPDTVKSPQSIDFTGFAACFFLCFLTFFLTKRLEK